MATKRKKKDADLTGVTKLINEVQVVKGSHLTVTTYPDGRTELKWDDAALQRECEEAITSLKGK